MVLFASLLSKVIVPSTERSRISPWLIRLAYPLGCHLILPLYLGRLTVIGREHIPAKDPVIVAPLHRARWDALIVPYAVGHWVSGRNLRFMVMSAEMKGLQGWLIRHLGGFAVDTRHPRASSLEHSVELLKKGETLVMFPEGGIFRDDIVHPLKRGVARIALEVKAQQPTSDLKILPISIRYSQPYPSWKTDVTVIIGEALSLETYSTEHIKTSSEKLTQDLQHILVNLCQKSSTIDFQEKSEIA